MEPEELTSQSTEQTEELAGQSTAWLVSFALARDGEDHDRWRASVVLQDRGSREVFEAAPGGR